MLTWIRRRLLEKSQNKAQEEVDSARVQAIERAPIGQDSSKLFPLTLSHYLKYKTRSYWGLIFSWLLALIPVDIWIRVSGFLAPRIKWGIFPKGGCRLVYIGRSVNPEPSDQTDLNKRWRLDLNGGGEPTFEAKTDGWVPWAGRPAGGANRPHMSAPRGLLWWVALQHNPCSWTCSIVWHNLCSYCCLFSSLHHSPSSPWT